MRDRKRMRQLFATLLVLTLLVCIMPTGVLTVYAAREYTSGFYTYTVYENYGEATIEFLDTEISGNISIPSRLGGYKVTKIDNGAFSGCENITSIIIPNSVASIGETAFYGCTNLTNVIIPESVTTVGKQAFMYCSALSEVTLPSGITSIPESFFYKCSNLKSVTMPNTIKSIGKQAFYGCTNLTDITIPDSVEEIGVSAFQDCSALQSIIVPNTVTSIHDQTFSGCSALSTVIIPDSVTEINRYAFYDCSSLINVTIPNGVKSIGFHTFSGCSSLKSISLPDSLRTIEKQAFVGCSSLISIIIPFGVSTIDYATFLNCTSLESITIPVSVASIGEDAFKNCTGLTDVYYRGTEEQKKGISFGKNNGVSGVIWHYDSCIQSATHSYDYTCDAECNVCKKWRSNAYHNYEWVIDEPGTCVVDGIKHRECTICHDKTNINTPIIAKGKHEYDNAADVSCNLCDNIRTLSRISISKKPIRLSFLERKDVLDVAGGEITVFYEDGTEATVYMTEDMVSGFDNTKVGSQELIVTYSDCTTSFEIEILAKVLVDIKVTQLPSKTEYLESKEVLDLSGGKLTLYYSNDTSQQIDLSEATVSGFDNSAVGSKSIVVVYDKLTTTFSVDVVAKTLAYIEVTTKPNKLTYLEGDAFDKAGMVVTAYYNNDTSAIATNYSVSGYTSTPGTKTIAVSYNGKSAFFTVVVEAKTLSSISVTKKSQKTTYIESTALDDTGMVLTLYYNNNTSETITTGWVSEYDFSNVGTSVVEVTYGGKTCTYDVTVIAKTLTSIVVESEPNKLEYLEGDTSLDTDGLEIKAYYDNDTSEVINDNYTVTGYDSTPGTKTITVTYGGKIATFTVEVVAKSVTSIAVTKKPNKLTYLEGESFDKTGMVITAYYNNNTSGAVTDYTVSGYTSTIGTKTITVSYGGKSATFTVTVNSRVPSAITSSKYTVSGTNISKIGAGTTVANLLNGLGEGFYCKVYNGSSVVSGNTAVGTGMTVKIMDGNTAKATYTIIVTGDTNGDGNITVTDMIAIKAHVLKKSTLSGAYATAADTNGDNGISITDFIQVKAKILGKGTITAR